MSAPAHELRAAFSRPLRSRSRTTPRFWCCSSTTRAALGIATVVGEGRVPAAGVTAGWFDDDHVGAEVAEHLARDAPCSDASSTTRSALQRPGGASRTHMTPSAAAPSISASLEAEHLAEHLVVVLAEAGPAALDRPVGLGEVHRDAVDAHVAHLGVRDGGHKPHSLVLGSWSMRSSGGRTALPARRRPRSSPPASRMCRAAASSASTRASSSSSATAAVSVAKRSSSADRWPTARRPGALQSSSSRQAMATQLSSPRPR